MNHHTLREIAKVGAGLILAGLIGVIWFPSAILFPLTMLGVAVMAFLSYSSFHLALHGWR